MDGLAGLDGWRWIFILEGISTVIVGALCFFLLCDSPALSARWLDAEEIRYLELRQLARRSNGPLELKDKARKQFDVAIFNDIFWDYKIYLLVLANWSNAVPNYAMKFTMPTILTSMGYQSEIAQLLTIPPYAFGAISSYAFAIFADKYSWRYPFLIGPQICVVVAFSVLFALSRDIVNNVAACYSAVCLAMLG